MESSFDSLKTNLLNALPIAMAQADIAEAGSTEEAQSKDVAEAQPVQQALPKAPGTFIHAPSASQPELRPACSLLDRQRVLRDSCCFRKGLRQLRSQRPEAWYTHSQR
ncbi:hypothetical protein PMIN06_007924 [Paraphaeosphaeria minitans]